MTEQPNALTGPGTPLIEHPDVVAAGLVAGVVDRVGPTEGVVVKPLFCLSLGVHEAVSVTVVTVPV